MSAKVKYFVFDVESVADGDLVSQVRYPGESLDSQAAVARYRKELMEERNSDFIPYTFQLPVSVVIAKVTADFEIDDIVLMASEEAMRAWAERHRPST